MRRLIQANYDCNRMRFNTVTQDEQRQGYRCKLTGEKCVGHMTLPIPYIDIGAQWDPIGLYAILRKDIVRRCPSRELNDNLEAK